MCAQQGGDREGYREGEKTERGDREGEREGGEREAWREGEGKEEREGESPSWPQMC